MPFVEAAFVQPPYWARVGLRIATSLPKGHRWSRWAIDRWRKRRGTALNQSTAGIAGRRSPYALRRTLVFEDDSIRIEDAITSSGPPLDPSRLDLVLDSHILLDGRHASDPDRHLPLSTLGLASGGPAIHLVRTWSRDGMVRDD
jgi:hypothetical protein